MVTLKSYTCLAHLNEEDEVFFSHYNVQILKCDEISRRGKMLSCDIAMTGV